MRHLASSNVGDEYNFINLTELLGPGNGTRSYSPLAHDPGGGGGTPEWKREGNLALHFGCCCCCRIVGPASR